MRQLELTVSLTLRSSTSEDNRSGLVLTPYPGGHRGPPGHCLVCDQYDREDTFPLYALHFQQRPCGQGRICPNCIKRS